MRAIISFLETVKLARKQSHENLTVFPVLGPNNALPDYLVLEEALELGQVRVMEMGEEGSVPDLILINNGKKSVLVIEGEELVGAKQNRTVNVSFLVPGKSKLVIPVSCVEQGRWHYRERDFHSGKKLLHAGLRHSLHRGLAAGLAEGRGYRSDQREVWRDIGQKARRMDVDSPTLAATDIFDRYEDRLDSFVQALRRVEHQVGAVFAINGRAVGMELFGYADTYAGFSEKLVKSYGLDALDRREEAGHKPAAPEQGRRIMASVMKSRGEEHPAVGAGASLRFGSRTVSGSALKLDDRVLHLSAFRREAPDGAVRVGYGRFSQRRARRTD